MVFLRDRDERERGKGTGTGEKGKGKGDRASDFPRRPDHSTSRSRFNGPERGAWYAAFQLETAQAEIAFHKWIELAEVGWTEEELTYDDYLADFSAEFHDIRRDKWFAEALAPDSYVASQGLAQELLDAGSLGIVYPSVRRRGGTCLACFRPALVMNVRKGRTYRFRWDGAPKPSISAVR